ncbi:MAG: hypothetical protein R3F55_19655 [Alphaproteobacteria bacterium]
MRAGLVGTLVDTTERLADVLQRETDFLRQMNLKGAAEVQVEKATLAETYEKCVRELSAGEGAAFVALAGRERAALQKVGKRLVDASSENERALRAVRQVNERVLAAIVDAAREQRTASHAYGTRGFAAGNGALSLALDRQL